MINFRLRVIQNGYCELFVETNESKIRISLNEQELYSLIKNINSEFRDVMSGKNNLINVYIDTSGFKKELSEYIDKYKILTTDNNTKDFIDDCVTTIINNWR